MSEKSKFPSVNPLVSNEMDSSSRTSSPANDSGSDSDSDIYMPYTSGHVEPEQLPTRTEESYYLTDSEGSGERNNGGANVYVDSAARDSPVSLTSGATPIPKEIAPAFGVLRTDTSFVNMVSQM